MCHLSRQRKKQNTVNTSLKNELKDCTATYGQLFNLFALNPGNELKKKKSYSL